MEVTRAALVERLAQLRAAHGRTQTQLNALDGAIQECVFWLRRADAPDVVVRREVEGNGRAESDTPEGIGEVER